VPEDTLSVLDGSTFVLGDRRGDLIPGDGREHGFFSDDTRFLSRWALRVNDTPLDLLGLDQSAHFAAQFFLTPRVATDDAAPCSVMRRRCVDRVWLEEITIVNHRLAASAMLVELDIDSDFADLFEVKGATVAQRAVGWRADGDALMLEYSVTRVSRARSRSPAAARRRSRAMAWPSSSCSNAEGSGRSRCTSPRAPRSPERRSLRAP
jgi:glycogen debranching enzyme